MTLSSLLSAILSVKSIFDIFHANKVASDVDRYPDCVLLSQMTCVHGPAGPRAHGAVVQEWCPDVGTVCVKKQVITSVPFP